MGYEMQVNAVEQQRQRLAGIDKDIPTHADIRNAGGWYSFLAGAMHGYADENTCCSGRVQVDFIDIHMVHYPFS